ncbi:hypothetical protein BC830DRAFT_1094315 [Chytriomyces sp. MP71]|nr:hypothetical protein BC830DRAFT_1094315 [Chytriomyces sp. MP71]
MSERKVKGSKATSASRVADLVASGPAFGGGFTAFGAGGATPSSLSSSTLLPEEVEHLDAEIKVLLKRLAKKDAQTKIKATEDLKMYLALASEEQLANLVYVWPKIFSKTCLDVERKIRENLIACQSIMFTRLKKEMAPVLKQLIGPWLCLRFDNASAEVAKQASETFERAFPNKRADVLAFCRQEIFSFVSDNVVYHTVETMSDSRYNTIEEMQAKYIRVVSGSFATISFLYENIAKTTELTETFTPLFESSKFWDTAKSPYSPIRRSIYTLVKTLSLLDPATSPLAQYLPTIKTAFLNECFADREPSTHDALWDAVLSLTRAFPTIWAASDLTSKKGAPMRLLKFLEAGCFGGGPVSWPALLALVAVLPKEILEAQPPSGNEEVAETFRDRFLNSLWTGLGSANVTPRDSSAFVNAVQECSLYLLLKYGVACSNSLQEIDFFKVAPLSLARIVEALLFPANNPDARLKLQPEDLAQAVCNYVAKVTNTSSVADSYSAHLLNTFCEGIQIAFINTRCLDGVDMDKESFITFCQRTGDLLSRFDELANIKTDVKDKLKALSLNLVAKALERLCLPGEHLTASMILFTNLSTKLTHTKCETVSDALRVFVASGLKNVLASDASSPLFTESVMKWLASSQDDSMHESFVQSLVKSGNTIALNEYLSKLPLLGLKCTPFPHFDAYISDLVLEPEISPESETLIVKSLLLVGPIRPISADVVSKIVAILRDTLDSFLINVVFKKPTLSPLRVEKMLGLLARIADLSMESFVSLPQAVYLSATVLELASYKVVADSFAEISAKSYQLWNTICLSSVKIESLAQEVMRRWRAALLDASHLGTSADFAGIFSKLRTYCAPESGTKDLLEEALFDANTWVSLKTPHYRLHYSLAILDSSCIVPDSVGLQLSSRIGHSTYARLAHTLAGVMSFAGAMKSALFSANVFELVVFWTLCKDEENMYEGKGSVEFDGQVDDAIALALQADDGASWTQEAIHVVNEGNLDAGGFVVNSFKIAFDSGMVEARAFGKIAKSGYGLLNASGRDGVIDLLRALFDKGSMDLLTTLSQALQKGLNLESASTFMVDICRACQIPKSELSNPKSVDRVAAGLFLLKSMLASCDDITSTAFAPGINVLVKHFRVWYMSSNDVIVSAVPSLLNARVAEFLTCLVEGQMEMEINIASFIVELTKVMVMEHSSKVVLYYALDLFLALTSADSDLWIAIDKFSDGIHEICLEQFLTECLGENLTTSSRAQRELQSRLAYICGAMPNSILLKKMPQNQLSQVMFTYNVESQIAAYQLLTKLTTKVIDNLSVKLEMAVGSDAINDKFISTPLLEGMQCDIPFAEPSYLIDSKADLHLVYGFLLTWMAVLDHFNGATYVLRSSLIHELKEVDAIAKLLEFIFFILGVGCTMTPFDLTGWEFSSIEMEGLDFESEIGISLLCAHIYYRVLRHIPSIARTWWSSCKDRQLTQAVEAYTDKWFSPLLVQADIDLVLTTGSSTLEDMDLKASKKFGEITVMYHFEDATTDLGIKFPPAFPMKPVEFTSNNGGRAIGVKEGKWGSWMLRASIIAQDTSILDALILWQKNVKLHFEGKEECSICYSVVGVIDKTLPSKSCRTCNNAFHASCLFKWIRTSGNTQCPMCRSEL